MLIRGRPEPGGGGNGERVKLGPVRCELTWRLGAMAVEIEVSGGRQAFEAYSASRRGESEHPSGRTQRYTSRVFALRRGPCRAHVYLRQRPVIEQTTPFSRAIAQVAAL